MENQQSPPSYYLVFLGVEMFVFSHQTNGHAERIESVKPMFVEPKGKGTFNEVTL